MLEWTEKEMSEGGPDDSPGNIVSFNFTSNYSGQD